MSVYLTQASMNTDDKEIRTSTLNLSMPQTEAIPTNSISKRSQLNQEDSTYRSQILKE